MSLISRWSALLFITSVLLTPPALHAADAPPKPEPSAVVESSAPETPEDFIVPALDIQDIGLNDFVDVLQGLVPGFKAVVVRDSGVSTLYPAISLKLKQVSVGQILQLLQTAYGVEMEQIPGGKGVLYCMKVHQTPAVTGDPAVPNEQNNTATVKVYPLSEVVKGVIALRTDEPKDRTAATKDSLDTILSLIKAAVTQASDPKAPPTLQVHESTQTLIFKGNAAQREALEDVIAALQGRHPVEEKQISDLKTRLELLQKALNSEKRHLEPQAEPEKPNERLESDYLEQAAETERLKVRTEEQALQLAAAREALAKQQQENERLLRTVLERDLQNVQRERAQHQKAAEKPEPGSSKE